MQFRHKREGGNTEFKAYVETDFAKRVALHTQNGGGAYASPGRRNILSVKPQTNKAFTE